MKLRKAKGAHKGGSGAGWDPNPLMPPLDDSPLCPSSSYTKGVGRRGNNQPGFQYQLRLSLGSITLQLCDLMQIRPYGLVFSFSK